MWNFPPSPFPRFQCWVRVVAISGGPWKKNPRPENTHCDILPNIETGGKGVRGRGANALTCKHEFQLFSPIYGLRKNEHSPTYMTKFTKRSARGSRFCLLCCQPVPVRRLSCARTVQLTPRSPCAPWACSTKQDSRVDHRAQRLPHNCHAVATQLPRSCHTFATGKICIRVHCRTLGTHVLCK